MPKSPPTESVTAETTMAGVHDTARRRLDAWNRLRDTSRRLARAEREGRELDPSLIQQVTERLEFLAGVEAYFVFPGLRMLRHLTALAEDGQWEACAASCTRAVRLHSTGLFKRIDLGRQRVTDYLDVLTSASEGAEPVLDSPERPYFQVLVVDDLSATDERGLRIGLRTFRQGTDRFLYELVVVRSFEDALLAVLVNPSIAAVIARFAFPFASPTMADLLQPVYTMLRCDRAQLADMAPGDRTARLGTLLKQLRPELDIYRVTDAPMERIVGRDTEAFRRIFYQSEDHRDVHIGILRGVQDRFETPFFDALRRYSERPTGMFHALPVSQGRTIAKSDWIRDFGAFYGPALFFAETSATAGGLDSLLQPTGSLKHAQEMAARAFGADHTFYVTNGTSTANKVVMQALARPGDIVLLSHDCHKSHPYAAILMGATPIYLDPYPLSDYSMYGGVCIEEIERVLRQLESEGKLDKVRLLLLTNITFDGITYDPYRVMKRVLAIKPDIVFVWDEAWFAYGRFSALLRQRTATDCAKRLDAELRSEEYKRAYDAHRAAGTADGMPDPRKARVRVYATQSTHKTLTALRQGSMIHVWDVDYERLVEQSFHEAYMTHTSTSPNYQILASLDVGRRQVELEGHRFVADAIDLSLMLRERIRTDPLLARYFSVLGPAEMVPAAHRPSGITQAWARDATPGMLERAWRDDEFVLDPTRVTLHVGRTGMDGDTFKQLLMSTYDIHINKTSRNTILLLVHVGMTRGTLAHLVKVLTTIATGLDRRLEHAGDAERAAFDAKVASLVKELPPLPNFSCFHPFFRPDPQSATPEGDIRRAYFLAYDESACRHVPLDEDLLQSLRSGASLVAASFVTPYPPGFPVLVPGQVLTPEIVQFLLALDVKEIHGFQPDIGLRVFAEHALSAGSPPRVAAPSRPHVTTAEGAESSLPVALLAKE